MGFLDGIKDFYFGLEDRYYKILDKVDAKIPVYKVIDPIDRVVPSFALLLILIALLLMFGAFALLGGLPAGAANVIITVEDDDGSSVPNAIIELGYYPENPNLPISVTTDSFGEATVPGVALDSTVDYVIAKEGYEETYGSFSVYDAPEHKETIVLVEEEELVQTRTVRLLDSLGMAVTDAASLSFSCSNPYATAPADVTAYNGFATVEVPTNCQKLYVSVEAYGFENVDSQLIEESDNAIYLDAVLQEEATIMVNVTDEEGKPLDGITVELYKYYDSATDPYIGPVGYKDTLSGQVIFNKPADSYTVKTHDPSGKYGPETADYFTVESGQVETVTIALSENVVGDVKVQVLDKSTGEEIGGAKVRYMYADTKETIKTLTTNASEDAIVALTVTQDVQYDVSVEADGYKLGKVSGLRAGEAVNKVELEKCTPLTCGKLIVKVEDQDGKAVGNATVTLYSSSSGFLAGYSNRVSDVNGIAEFYGVGGGDYWAYAFKQGSSGKSGEGAFESGRQDEDVDYTVVMEIGSGTIQINATDQYKKPIERPVITVYDSITGKQLGSAYGDTNGQYTLETKADKKVYVVVEKKDGQQRYTDYISPAKEVIASSTVVFNAVMEPEIINKDVEVEFLGLYRENLKATTLAAGEEYTAKFRVRVPEEKNYDELGLHVRTGNDKMMEKDNIYIKKINAPTTSITKGTLFDPKSGLDEQQYEFTTGDAKWFNARWANPRAGIFEVEAVVKVKESATVGKPLHLRYRAWGLKDSQYDRHPEDKVIESYEFYNETFETTYQVGVVTLCDEDFCFTAYIEDITERLSESVSDSYLAKIYNDYRLHFEITNNSASRIHNNANIRIKNPERSMLFTTYKFKDADGVERNGAVNSYEFDKLGIDLGNMGPNKKIVGDIWFLPQKSIASTINMLLVSDQQPVYSKNLIINTSAAYGFEATVSPKTLPSGIENDVNVYVIDAQTKQDVADAVVTVEDFQGNTIALERTGLNGYAHLVIPAQAPGEELTVTIEKPSYDTAEETITVNADVLKFSPDSLGLGLNSQAKFEDSASFSARNLAGFPVQIKTMELKGRFKGLLDEQRMENWLAGNYKTLTISAGQKEDFALKAYLSEDGKLVRERVDLDGELIVEAENFGNTWYFNLPVTVSVGVGKELDDPSCLVVTTTEWETATEGNTVLTEFQIMNTCTIDGNPVALKDLQAKVNWKSNVIGSYSLVVENDKTELAPGHFKMIIGTLEPEAVVSAVLEFTPFGGVDGIAEADVEVKAVNPVEGGNQELSNTINTKISTKGVSECLTFSKNLLEMDEEGIPEAGANITPIGRNEDTFTITTEGCGGAVDILIESDLEVRPKVLTLADDSTSEEILVRGAGEVPGQYSVVVFSKRSSESQHAFTRNIRARIYPLGCIQLNRFEFDLYDNPESDYDGYDTAELVNMCPDTSVSVEIDTTDWKSTLENGFKGLLAGFGMGLMQGGLDLGSLGGEGGGLLDTKRCSVKEYCDTPRTITFERGGDVSKDLTCVKGGERIELTCTECTRSLGKASCTFKEENGDAGDGADNKCTGSPQACAYNVEVTLGNPKYVACDEYNLYKCECEDGKAECSKIGTNSKPESAPWLGPAADKLNAPAAEEEESEESEGEEAEEEMGTGAVAESAPPIKIPSSGFASFGTNAMTGHVGFWTMTGLGLVVGAATYMFGEHTDTADFIFPDISIDDIAVVSTLVSVVEGEVSIDPATHIDPDVDVEEIGRITESKQGSALNTIEKYGLAFTNSSAFTTEEKEPLYKYLYVSGSRWDYSELDDKYGGDRQMDIFPTEYDVDVSDIEGDVFDDAKRQGYDSVFRLEFNAIEPGERPITPTTNFNCQSGSRTGLTGTEAVPRVKLAWNWNDARGISANECDVGNSDYIYCDATQFSIEVLKKVKAIADFVERQGPFNCPSLMDEGVKENAIGDFDIGVGRIEIAKTGLDLGVDVEVENTNPSEITTDVDISVTDSEGKVTECSQGTQQVEVLSTERVSCAFSGLEEGIYSVKAEVSPLIENCEKCEDEAASNTLTARTTIGQAGVVECEPYSTERLGDFLSASGIRGARAEEVLDNVEFRAHLIKDRFTKDFQNDFDDYAMKESAFDAPTYYTDAEGLGAYFRDDDRFAFTSYFGSPNPEGYSLPGAGIYNVKIDITYEDDSWKLFDEEGLPNATITVKLQKADTPNPPSPFYSLPFNGPVGESSGRVGYGVNYEGDRILINSDSASPVHTVEIVGTTPVANLRVDKEDTFRALNVDNRGVVLTVQAGSRPRIIMSPSFATPVIMHIENETDEASAFYTVDLDGAQNTGPKMSDWDGIGGGCLTYSDSLALEEFWQTADTHGLNAKCTPIAGDQKVSSYGFEFCNPVNYGNLWLKSVLYTPQNKPGIMELIHEDDSAEIMTVSGRGNQIALEGVVGMPSNNTGDNISNIDEIFDLVEEGYVCVSGTDTKAEFWWNPKPLYDLVDDYQEEAISNCIGAEEESDEE